MQCLNVRTCSFFHTAMQADVFSIEKTHQHILFWREIHSFVSINDRNLTPLCPYSVSVLTIESVTRNLVIICFSDSKVSGTIACIFGLWFAFVQLISQEISQATSSLTFSNRNSILKTLDTILDPRDSILETIKDDEYRVSRLEGLSTYFWAVLYWSVTFKWNRFEVVQS